MAAKDLSYDIVYSTSGYQLWGWDILLLSI